MIYYLDVFCDEPNRPIKVSIMDSAQIIYIKKNQRKILSEGTSHMDEWILAILMTGKINLEEEFCIVTIYLNETLDTINKWAESDEIFETEDARPEVFKLSELRYAEFLLTFL